MIVVLNCAFMISINVLYSLEGRPKLLELLRISGYSNSSGKV